MEWKLCLAGQVLLTAFITTTAAKTSGSKLHIQVKGTRFFIGNERFFLSGANTAWVHYGADFGNNQYIRSRQEFLYLFSNVSQAGGNSMRTWVHVDGSTSPQFDSRGYVTGLDEAGTFLNDFRRYLDDARARNLLVFPTLWNGAAVTPRKRNLLGGLITSPSRLQSYLDLALIPWVRAVKDHPALGGWDIINEVEGVIIPGQRNDTEPCYDTRFLEGSTAGFAGRLYPAEDLLRFISWQADAIRQVDPSALVTAGSWRQWSQSDVFGGKNLYTDHCLKTAGGRAQGTLTFYSTHVYAILDIIFWPDAAFLHEMEEYKLDKPLVLAEFSQVGGAGWTIRDQFLWAYQKGYSGAWSWQATGTGSGSDSLRTQVVGIRTLRNHNNQTEGGRVPIHINHRAPSQERFTGLLWGLLSSLLLSWFSS